MFQSDLCVVRLRKVSMELASNHPHIGYSVEVDRGSDLDILYLIFFKVSEVFAYRHGFVGFLAAVCGGRGSCSIHGLMPFELHLHNGASA